MGAGRTDRPKRPGRLRKALGKNPALDAVRGGAYFLHDTIPAHRRSDIRRRAVRFSTTDSIPAARATGDSPKGRRVGVYTDLERHSTGNQADPARQRDLHDL
jgi:hypothetical protein